MAAHSSASAQAGNKERFMHTSRACHALLMGERQAVLTFIMRSNSAATSNCSGTMGSSGCTSSDQGPGRLSSARSLLMPSFIFCRESFHCTARRESIKRAAKNRLLNKHELWWYMLAKTTQWHRMPSDRFLLILSWSAPAGSPSAAQQHVKAWNDNSVASALEACHAWTYYGYKALPEYWMQAINAHLRRAKMTCVPIIYSAVNAHSSVHGLMHTEQAGCKEETCCSS